MTGFEAALPYIYAAAAAATAVGTVNASRAQAAAQQSNAAMEEYNATIAQQNADVAHRNAGAREDALRREADAKLAKQRAAIAQSGFDPGSGTLGLVQEQSADNAELDALMIRYAGNLEARGYNSERVLDQYRSTALKSQARDTTRGGYVSAGAGLLTSGSSYSRSGMKPGG